VTILHSKVDPDHVEELDAEALIREARRLRRRRWFVGVAVLALAGAATGISVTVDGAGNSRSGAPSGAGTSANAGSHSSRSDVAIAPDAPGADESGLVSPEEGWVANGRGLYLTTNAGRTWSMINPPNALEPDAFLRSAEVGLVAPDVTHFWVPVLQVGCTNKGSCGGTAIDSTTNAGRSWAIGYLPNCFHCNISVSFLNDYVGFAVGVGNNASGASTVVRTYATTNGGTTWETTDTFKASIDDEGSGLEFATPQDGWFVASALANSWLVDTTDGGAHWSKTVLPALPSGEKVLRFATPTFFGSADGMVAAAVEDVATRQDHDVIYTTSDGGARWSPSVVPAIVANSTLNGDDNLGVSVVSMRTWYVLGGDRLYVTRNGGRSWTSNVPSATWAHGQFQITGMDFATPAAGWVDLIYNECGGLPRGGSINPSCENEIALASTTSDGRSWTLVSST
jgi:hypothetical protein